MRNILCVYRRDLASYFTSPVGYIFIIVFVTVSVGLYITSFFSFPVADMRPYFENLPLILCVFIPAITMRLWAEERKENTWELLLTFPMKASELVLGKFLSAITVFAISLAATFTVPLMLKNLGNPDIGAIIGGYFGTLLLAACFLSLGIFFSGFCKDQIVAFVVTLLTCLLLFLLGTSFIASYIDDKLPGLGSLFSNLLGVFKHFGSFTKGVIDIA
ncbi:MAG TPA: ABC transporter permease, partial [Candidatus Hydrogenedens sp.]|nr:ABC transporter permease [Candidatus Hydrogenedens sp.]